MTAVGVPVMLIFGWGWLIVPLSANAGGAIADLWMTLTLLGCPPTPDFRTIRTASGSMDGRAIGHAEFR